MVAYECTVSDAIKKGDLFTKLSAVLMGAGNLFRGQVLKGFFFLASEIIFLLFMLKAGLGNLFMLPSLGEHEQQEVWNDAKGVFEYVAGHNSLIILLYGVATLFILAGFILLWRENMRSAYLAQILKQERKPLPSFIDDIKSLFDSKLQRLLLSLPIMGVLAFTVIPLVFMISMAFTNYSIIDNKLVLFDWVGLANFKKVLSFGDTIGKTFWSVLGWTITWAFFATFLNYFLGMILALVINRKTTRLKGLWRFCFVLSIAVPQFVSLLIMRTMLNSNGAVNVLLKNLGFISESLPFFTNPTWSRVTVIIINLWVGIPFTLLQLTGVLQNIPSELYEAADVDGASPFVKFFSITLPYMLFVTAPYLVTAFTGNVNNFNVIYLLSGGDPVPVGSTAGKTDLLVTWLYKLTIDRQYYNIGAVIGIMTFIVLAISSLLVYRNLASYKNEEAMR